MAAIHEYLRHAYSPAYFPAYFSGPDMLANPGAIEGNDVPDLTAQSAMALSAANSAAAAAAMTAAQGGPVPTTAVPPIATVTPNTVMPSIVGQANASSSSPTNSSVLTPTDLLNPLPQIVPGPTPDNDLNVCSPLTQWVASNPLLAAGLLAIGFIFAMKGKR